jgi:hypothetical protein
MTLYGKSLFILNTLLLPHPLPRRAFFHHRLLRRLQVLHEKRRYPFRDQHGQLNTFCSCPMVRAIHDEFRFSSRTDWSNSYAAFSIFAHRARCAAAIRPRPAAER